MRLKPSSYEILKMIEPKAPQEWEYRIPKFFFEAAVLEVTRAGGLYIKRMPKWRAAMLKGKIVHEWDNTPTRAQIAMIEYTIDRARRLRSHAEARRSNSERKRKGAPQDCIKGLRPLAIFWDSIKVSQIRFKSRIGRNSLIEHSTYYSLPSGRTNESKRGHSQRQTTPSRSRIRSTSTSQ